MNDVIKLLKELTDDRFYGAITLNFNAGKIVFIRKEQTFTAPFKTPSA